MGRSCAVIGCSNGYYVLERWKGTLCLAHECNFGTGRCDCPAPFTLFPFPTETKDCSTRKEWVRRLQRKDPITKRNWEPKYYDRVCSTHFIDGMPTEKNPYPVLHLGHPQVLRPGRAPPTPRQFPETSKPKLPEELCESDRMPEDETVPEDEEMVEDLTDSTDHIQHDHTYNHQGHCEECAKKDKIILELRQCMEELTNKLTKKKDRTDQSDCDKYVPCTNTTNTKLESERFVKTDKRVKLNTGLKNKKLLDALFTHLEPRVRHLRYRVGKKKVVSKKGRRHFASTPKKSGPLRKLHPKDEFILVLMKLRLGVTNSFLADLFNIAASTCSQILNTWLKFLSAELKPLILWPRKEAVVETLPPSMHKVYGHRLRCTLDCTEVYIERPRQLEIQAATWSDYKHHNTIKVLVCISPNGHISFLSACWGGRASDRHIVRESGFLELVEPGDLILADRGFTIQSDLTARFATLEIPPPSQGSEQMTPANVKKTKRIANTRIHVERAIGRMKWFQILRSTVPLTLVPLMDDIIVVCAALCNLLPPLVQK